MAKEKIKNNKEKNKNKVNGKNFIVKNRMLVGIAMLACSIILGLFFLPQMGKTTEYTIYTLKSSVSTGSVVTAKMLNETKTSDSKLADLAVGKKNLDALDGFVANHSLTAGSYLLKSDISEADGSGGTDIVPVGKQIISVPVSSIYSAVSFKLSKDDIISFYSTYTDENNDTVAYIPKNLKYVQIYEVYDSAGIPCAQSGGAPASISLIVTEAQAFDIVTLTNTSKVYYSLISSGDIKKAEVYVNHQQQILDGKIKETDEVVDMSTVDTAGEINENTENRG